MADNLNDQWSMTDETTEEDKFEGLEVSLPADGKRGFKRKLAIDGTKSKSKESKSNGPKVKKRKEKKKISNESEEILSKAGEPEDLRSMITKELKDRLNPDALDDCLPNADIPTSGSPQQFTILEPLHNSFESDFYPVNEKSDSPADYLKHILPRWRETVKKSLHMRKTGSPCVLVITSSAIRAVELNRQLKEFTGDKSKIAKLFSKHIKVDEQKKFLSKTICQVGIGTPNRILLLIKQGALQLESLVAVVLDWNWRDAKLKRLPDIPEIRCDLTTLLKDHLLETLQGSPCKIALL